MNLARWISKFVAVMVLVLAPLSSFAGVFISVDIAPPPLPVYEQPICPNDGYLWVPGYWAYGDYGYFWVPGTWVQPPTFGVLWTPGYWGWGDGGYAFHGGYWGPHVGFYGGVNYGFGYGGIGYGGGRWDGNRFSYNTEVNHVDTTIIHNTYVDKTTIINNNTRNVSYNGGAGGLDAKPTAEEEQAAHEHHVAATPAQRTHIRLAAKDRSQLASVNGGKPATLAVAKPDEYKKVAQEHAKAQPLKPEEKVKHNSTAAAKPEEKTDATKPEEKAPSDTVKPEAKAPEEKTESAPKEEKKASSEEHKTAEHKTEEKPHNKPAPEEHHAAAQPKPQAPAEKAAPAKEEKSAPKPD